jgi:hypothetical protein
MRGGNWRDCVDVLWGLLVAHWQKASTRFVLDTFRLQVYEGRDLECNRTVAIKIVRRVCCSAGMPVLPCQTLTARGCIPTG